MSKIGHGFRVEERHGRMVVIDANGEHVSVATACEVELWERAGGPKKGFRDWAALKKQVADMVLDAETED